jgi:hypothetical protein
VKRLPWWLAVVLIAAPAHAQTDAKVTELERQMEALSREVESLRLGNVADTVAAPGRHAVGSLKVYAVPRGVSLGGYGDMLYQNFGKEMEDGSPSGALDEIDFVRQVFYVGYKFDEHLLFNSEVEIEHGGVADEAPVSGYADPLTDEVIATAELSGEVRLEFAYVEWAPWRSVGMRAGLLLVPMGITNDLHEPPYVIGTRRPEVETRIIPTTWRANGAGLFGALPYGLEWRAYLMEGLDASGFSASGAIRGGRQSGSLAMATQAALAGRLDWKGASGVTLGASVFTGDAWQDVQPAPGAEFRAPVTMVDVHGRWQWSGLDARAVWVQGALPEAGALSDELGLVNSDRLGRRFWGAYGEAAFDVLPLLRAGTRYGLLPYARFERYDTQHDVPGGSDDPAFEVTLATAGLAFKPHPNVVAKADHQWRSTNAETGLDQWNVALGYVF